MTVAELMKKLEQVDPNLEVCYFDERFECNIAIRHASIGYFGYPNEIRPVFSLDTDFYYDETFDDGKGT